MFQPKRGFIKPTKGSCIVCSSPLGELGRQNNYVYSRCQACSTVQLDPWIGQTKLDSLYGQSEYAAESHGQGDPDSVRRASSRYYQHICLVVKKLADHGTVLDYGAGWGGLVEKLIASGFHVKGAEAAPVMVEECQRRNLPVERTAIENLHGEYDVITLCGVFEHLAEPDKLLSEAHRLLKPGGHLVTMQPCGEFAKLYGKLAQSMFGKLPNALSFFDPPWHLAFYTDRAIARLAARNGFRVTQVMIAPMGRFGGLISLVQMIWEQGNKFGWTMFGKFWPLGVSRTYVIQKI